MTGPAEAFARAAPGIHSATTTSAGEVLHRYEGELTDRDGTVRVLTLAPEATIDRIEQAFTRSAARWHNPSTHPNIVTVYERESEPRPWIAVELVDGRRLDVAKNTLTVLDVRTLATESAEAVRNAGLYKTRHGNVTPDNVWVCDDDDDGLTPLVGDWGLERACRLAADVPTVTRFTAPELLVDPDSVTEQTDVYGLGALSYYALTDRPPVTARANLELAILDGDVTPPSEHVSGIPEAVDKTLLTALSTKPADRQESAHTFGSAIREALPATVETDGRQDDHGK